MAPETEFGLLGSLAARVDGRLVSIPAAKQRAVLAALLLRAGRAVTLEELVEVVWGGTPPASARVTLQNYARRLRLALGDGGRSLIATVPQGYQVNIDDHELDVTRFETLQRHAQQAAHRGDWESAATQLRSALALWRGEPLSDVPSELLIVREKPRLQEIYLQAVEARIDADLHLNRQSSVIPELRELTVIHALREQLHAMLMLALYRDGQQGEALAAYQRARHGLVHEIGVEPGPALRDLQQRILRGDPALIPPRRALPAGPRPGAAAPAPAKAASPGATPGIPGARPGACRWLVIPHQLPAPTRHFAGRAAELRQLSGLLDEAAAEAGTMAIAAISGTAGVGKTALAVHWAHQVADRFPDGQLYVDLRGFGATGPPITAAEALRGFLDALCVPPGHVPVGAAAQAGLYRSVLAGQRVLVVLDNARHSGQVRPLLPGSPGCLVVVTSRGRLSELEAADGASPLRLDLLAEIDARDLLARRLGRRRVAAEDAAAEDAAAGDLAALCARLPLALAIAAGRAAPHPDFRLADLVAELREARSRLDVLESGEPGSDVRAVFSWSYRSLTEPAARVFRLIGVHPGPHITAAAVASMADVPLAEARRTLRDLATVGLLSEPLPGRYAFHDLLRAYAAEQADIADEHGRATLRRLLDHCLHSAYDAGLVLSPARDPITLPPRHAGVVPERFADPERALAWFGAEHQVLLAVARLAAATGFDTHAWQIPWAIEDYLLRCAHWHDWAATQRGALAAAERLRHLGGQARAHANLGRINVLFGAPEEARAHYQRSLELFREIGDHAGEAHALDHLGRFYANIGEHERAIANGRRALALHQELKNREDEAATLDSLGYAHYGLGRYADAIPYCERAAAAFGELGDRGNQAGALRLLAETYRSAGHPTAARDAWRQAVTLTRR